MAEVLVHDMDTGREAVEAYDAEPQRFLNLYESVRFEEVHTDILDLIPQAPTRVLDVGAGSGRDAAALAEMGHEVVAVEPSQSMRLGAQNIHKKSDILWLDDMLPDLSRVKKLGVKFGFILLSAVWMHLAPRDRSRAFRSLVDLLKENGRLVITLRLGEPEPKRQIFQVTEDEVKELGEKFGVSLLRVSHPSDKLRRKGIMWATVVFEK